MHSVVSPTQKWNFHIRYMGETKDTALSETSQMQLSRYAFIKHLCVRNLMWSNSCTQKGAGREGTWEASFLKGRVSVMKMVLEMMVVMDVQ